MDSSDEDRPIRKNERKRANALLDDNTDDTADEMKAMDSSDEDRPVKKRRKRKNVFLDDEASDTNGESEEMSDSEDGDLSDFIDDSSLKNDSGVLAEQKALEIQKNIIALTNHVTALSIAERDVIGLSFAYTTIENIFE